MTESGYVSGGFNSSSEQLKTAAQQQFAKYLVNVTEHLEDEYGIDVDTIDPLNEPNTNYWGTTLSNGKPVGGRQEGMHVGPARQAQQRVFHVSGLTAGEHTLRVVNKQRYADTGRLALIDAFIVETPAS